MIHFTKYFAKYFVLIIVKCTYMTDVKTIRKTLSLSQEGLASKLGVSARTVQNWEKGGKVPETSRRAIESLVMQSNIQTGEYSKMYNTAEVAMEVAECQCDYGRSNPHSKCDEDSRYSGLELELRYLRDKVAEKDARIEELNRTIARLEKMNDYLMQQK